MELAAAELHLLTRQPRYLRQAAEYARQEPVTPWMGADTARHYQWFPWHNNGHHALWRGGGSGERRQAAAYYRRGLDAVAARADNGFRVGIPFIWCSNNLMASFATQAYLYRRMTGDARYREHEAAALDWLFGANPWGVSMVIGLPQGGEYARDPHSVIAKQLGAQLTGGLLDGPVYRSIYQNLKGIRLHAPDRFARFNTASSSTTTTSATTRRTSRSWTGRRTWRTCFRRWRGREAEDGRREVGTHGSSVPCSARSISSPLPRPGLLTPHFPSPTCR
jgi:hypothetical protein